jgi:DUF971 family protein
LVGVPLELAGGLDRTRKQLSILWEDGSRAALPAVLLRERARDANSIRLEADGWAVPAAQNLTIAGVEPIGNYAVRLAFSDGHDRGIFPWSYLAELAASAGEGAGNG